MRNPDSPLQRYYNGIGSPYLKPYKPVPGKPGRVMFDSEKFKKLQIEEAKTRMRLMNEIIKHHLSGYNNSTSKDKKLIIAKSTRSGKKKKLY